MKCKTAEIYSHLPLIMHIIRGADSPIYSHVLLHAKGEYLKISATNGHVTYSAVISCAVEEEGTICINGEKLCAILNDHKEEVTISGDRDKSVVAFKKSKYTLSGMPWENFPKETEKPHVPPVIISTSDLKDLIRDSFCHDKVGDIPSALSCIQMTANNGLCTAISTNKLLFSCISKPCGGQMSITIPANVIPAITKFLVGDSVEIVADARTVFLMQGTTKIEFKQIALAYPNVSTVFIGENARHSFKVNHGDLGLAISRILASADQKSGDVAMEKRGDTIQLSAKNALADGVEVVDIREATPDDFRIHVNGFVLLEFITHLDRTILVRLDELEKKIELGDGSAIYMTTPRIQHTVTVAKNGNN